MNKLTLSLIAGSLLLGGVGGATLGGGTELVNVGFDPKGQNVKIQVLIKEPNFQDAIYYTPNEWNIKTKENIDAQKLERFTNWQKIVSEQSKVVSPELTREQMEEQKAILEAQLNEINAKLH